MKYNESKIPDISKEDIENFNNDMRYVYVAHNKLLKKLFGFVPENPSDYLVERKVYAKALKEVQKEFHFEDGEPKSTLFVLEQLIHSPRFID